MLPDLSTTLHTIPQLADRLGVTPPSVRAWIKKGQIEPPQEIPATGEKVFSSEAAARIEHEYMIRAANGGTRGPGTAERREQACAYLKAQEVSQVIEETPADMVLDEVHRWLELEDDLLPLVVLTVAVANRLPDSDPVWLMIVAPPSSGKTELIQAVEGIDGVYGLGKLTGRTFVSGMGGEDRSLLTWLSNQKKWLLTHKDWGTVMNLNPTERNEVLSQLRQIYDGKFDATWGTGAKVHWRGKLGFLVGATPAVDRLQKWSTELGERFVQFRPTAPDAHRVTVRASLNKGREGEMRSELASAYRRAFSLTLNTAGENPDPSPEGDLVAGAIGRFVAEARRPVSRDRYSGGFQVDEAEGPARLTGIFTILYRAAYTVLGGDHERAIDLVLRVGLDSVTPGIRRKLISQLAGAEDGLVVDGLGRSLGCDDNTARTHLDDLCAIGLAERSQPANTVIYRVSPAFADLVSQVYLDEFEPEEALRKLSLLHADCTHDGEEEEREAEDCPTSLQPVGR